MIYTFRKKYEKTLVYLLLFFSILVGISTMPVKAARTEANIPRKIISIVYDDSGSMFYNFDKTVEIPANARNRKWWSQANYAMQSFAALLNPQDTLFVTYMSDITRLGANAAATPINLQNPKEAIKSIQEYQHFGSRTPLSSVELAADTLLSVNDTDINTQYWLVVLTDGDPEEVVNGKKTGDAEYQPVLDKYAQIKAPNGTDIQIKFVKLGNDSKNTTYGNNNNFVVKEAGENIVGTLKEIANQITGRLVAEDKDITISGDTITVKSALPLYSISIFNQESTAQVVSAQTATGEMLDTQESLSLNYITSYIDDRSGKQEHNYEYDETLYGTTCLITGPDSTSNIIEAGTYTIKCSENISDNNITVMVQPSIELQVFITVNGKELSQDSSTGFDELLPADDINIELRPVDPITKQTIDMNLLPKDTKWGITYSSDSGYINSTDQLTLQEKILPEQVHINGFMQLPDMCPQVFEEILINANENIDLELSIKKDGVDVTDFNTIIEGDNLDIEVVPVNKISRAPIDLNTLPSGVSWDLDFSIDGNQINASQNQSLNITTGIGSNNIHAIMTIPEPSGTSTVIENNYPFDIEVYVPQLATSNVTITKTDLLNPLVVYDEAAGINMMDSLIYDDEILVEWNIIDQNTGNPINLSHIAGGNAVEIWEINHDIDGTNVNTAASNSMTTRVKTGHNVITGSYQLEQQTLNISPIEFDIIPPGIYSMEGSSSNTPYLRKKLADTPGCQKAEVKITFQEDADNDGVGDGPVTDVDSANLGNKEPIVDSISFTKDHNGLLRSHLGLIEVENVLEADPTTGAFYIYPECNKFIKLFLPYLMKTGEYTVNLVLSTDSSKTVQVSYKVEGQNKDWIPFLIELFLLLLLIYILLLLFVKKKFQKNYVLHLKVYKNEDGEMKEWKTKSLTINIPAYGSNRFSLFAAKYHIPKINLTLYANSEGEGFIKPKSLKGKTWGPSHNKTSFNAVERNISQYTEKWKKNPGEFIVNGALLFFKTGNEIISINKGNRR